MAESKKLAQEREYVIPLRSNWSKVARYKRTAKAVDTIKKFVAKHMRVIERDENKVKLDTYLNNELWHRGMKKPPAKVRVKVKRDGENVIVELAEMPDKWKFVKARQDKFHKKVTKKKVVEEKKEENKEEPTDANKDGVEDKVEEKEKAKANAAAQEKIMEKSAKAQKHTVSASKAPQVQRKALKK
jgi:large subunit ribosomal protein L31e